MKWFTWATVIAYALGAFTGAWLMNLFRGLRSKVA